MKLILRGLSVAQVHLAWPFEPHLCISDPKASRSCCVAKICTNRNRQNRWLARFRWDADISLFPLQNLSACLPSKIQIKQRQDFNPQQCIWASKTLVWPSGSTAENETIFFGEKSVSLAIPRCRWPPTYQCCHLTSLIVDHPCTHNNF